jgi:hypothetical protein
MEAAPQAAKHGRPRHWRAQNMFLNLSSLAFHRESAAGDGGTAIHQKFIAQ